MRAFVLTLALLALTGSSVGVQIISAATINAAHMLGREKEQGTIETGKAGDVPILDANPLEDIRGIRRIHRVVKGGVVSDPAQLPK